MCMALDLPSYLHIKVKLRSIYYYFFSWYCLDSPVSHLPRDLKSRIFKTGKINLVRLFGMSSSEGGGPVA